MTSLRRSWFATHLVVAWAAACSRSEFRESHFISYGQFRSSEVFEKHWAPRWISETATNIHEAHDLDTNAVFLAFSVPEGEHVQIKECVAVEERSLERPSLKGRSLDWWPVFLRKAAGPLKHQTGIQTYACTVPGHDTRAFLVVNAGERSVWYWELGS